MRRIGVITAFVVVALTAAGIGFHSFRKAVIFADA